MADVSLYDFAKAVRGELDKMRRDKGLQHDPTVALDSLDLEVSVGVKKEGKGGLKFYIVNAEAARGAETVTKVGLHFSAIAPGEAPPVGTGVVMLRSTDFERLLGQTQD